MPVEWPKIEAAFQAALDVPTVKRRAWLLETYGDDAELCREVESLLQAESASENFLHKPRLIEVASHLLSVDAEASRIRKLIGPYKILREIGRGGMGVVFLAEREDEEFQQRVAVKLVKRGLDTEDILHRFRNERQILASLNHPNIAKLFDGGTTEDGLPYFVMEYIEGLPLMKYCDSRSLSTDERLKLFRNVCAAVQHAHQNLIIHRDIKPSNILVTREGEVKLLDFGVAKFLNPESSGEATATRTALRAMTPEYASPEQVRGLHLTTATDIYSLGVVLYELLTGARPYKLKDASPEELSHAICDSEPSKPSEATTDSKTLSTNQQSAITNPKSLRGDIDNIVLMALRKEPERRYKSAEQFSEDIKKYLEGLPVTARKDTFSYRASKFIKRNRVSVAAAALIVLAILTALIVSIQQTRKARRESARAEAVSNFLQTILLSSSPTSATRRHKDDASLKDVLDDASKRLAAGELVGQPEVRAELLRIIGVTYMSLGRNDDAEQILTAALKEQIAIYGEDHLETLKTRVALSEAWAEKGNVPKLESFYRQYLPSIRTYQKQGLLSTDYLIGALYDLSLIRRAQGNSKEAEALLREVMTLIPQTSPDVQAESGEYEAVLALTLADQGKFDEAEKMVRATLAGLRRQSSDFSNSSLAASLSILGGALLGKGEYTEAEEHLREAEAIYRKVYGNDYRSLGDNNRIEAQVLYEEGKYAEAETKINETLKIYRASIPDSYINYATAVMIQGLIYAKTGRDEEGEKLLRQAVELRHQYSPEGHFLRAVAENELGQFLATHKRYDEAEPLLVSSYESLKNSQAPNSPRVRTALERLIAFYESWGRADRADAYRSKL